MSRPDHRRLPPLLFADMLSLLAALAAAGWLALLLHPAGPWRTREHLEAELPESLPDDFSALTVLIPARDEAEHLKSTISALNVSGRRLRIIVVDDQSTDNTAEVAAQAGAEVISGRPLPRGWTGKLWALEQGRKNITTPLILQLDADIELQPGMIEALLAKQRQGYQLVSVMALLPAASLVERWLMPPYVWFFKLLYPFALANKPGKTAAAAGGCLLIERDWLERIGGYGALRQAVIDDCTLAKLIKRSGGRIWIGLTHSALSRRKAGGLIGIKNLIARTAYTQLRHSLWLLAAATILLLLMFAVPAIAIFFSPGSGRWLGATAYAALFAAYLPLIRFYRLNPLWVVSLPFAAFFYFAATWISARRHWRGAGAVWKGRNYLTAKANAANRAGILRNKINPTPFFSLDIEKDTLRVLCCYHKCMTVYFVRVLSEFSAKYGLLFNTSLGIAVKSPESLDIFLDHESTSIERIKCPVRGAHIVRDPRDLLLSAYKYHLKTDETWCTEIPSPYAEVPKGISYQQHLLSLSEEQGLLFELRNATGRTLNFMKNWDYSRPEFLELRYEQILNNERELFREIFTWYGFNDAQVAAGVEIAEKYSVKQLLLSNDKSLSHIRTDSRIEQWRKSLPRSVKIEIDAGFGDLIQQLGYPPTFFWRFGARVIEQFSKLKNRLLRKFA